MHSNTQLIASILRYLQLIFFSSLILYLGRTLFIPLFFGLLIAVVMYPVCKWLENRGLGKVVSITCCLLIVGLFLGLLLCLLAWQVNVFRKDAPAILDKFEATSSFIHVWMIKNLGVTTGTQDTWIENLFGSIGTLVTSTLQTTLTTIFTFFLIPVYTTLFMYHRKVFIRYLKMITPDDYKGKLDLVLQEVIHTYFNYIKGTTLVYLIVGILNSIGLFFLGVQHALLFGMLCAIMTIIPYVGIVVSALLPISVVWLDTGNIWYPLGVIAVFTFVQYLEANLIFPKIVGTQLHVSTLAMLVAIFAGGIIWGVAGMVLFIPFIAMLKIVSDYIEELKPINLLLTRV